MTVGTQTPSLTALRKAIHTTLREWENPALPEIPPLSTLYLVQSQVRRHGVSTSRAIRLVLETGLDALAISNPRAADLVRRHFHAHQTFGEIIVAWGLKEINTDDQMDKLQRKALQSLAGYMLTEEQHLRARHSAALESSLVHYDTTLFGIEAIRAAIYVHLQSPTASPLMVISGLGGIGKTALATRVVRDIIPTLQFEHLVWVEIEAAPDTNIPPSAEQMEIAVIHQLIHTLLPEHRHATLKSQRQQVKTFLKAQPTLVVIDNIEHPTALPQLLEQLEPLAATSKFLFTSRVRAMSDLAKDFALEEIDLPAAIELLRHRAVQIPAPALLHATQTELASIYEVTGGHPKALLLVAGLTSVHEINRIVRHLRFGKTDDITAMYEDIYAYVWETLSPPAQRTLQVLALNSDKGILFGHLSDVSRLDELLLTEVITELHRRALVDMRHAERNTLRYAIHRLTERYVRRNILRFDDDSESA